jgi:HK97 family phage major capsid protein
MNILQQAGHMAATIETNRRATEFGKLVQFIAAHEGKFSKAAHAAQISSRNGNLGPKLATIMQAGVGGLSGTQIKAAVTAMNLSGSPFADYSLIAQGFVASLVNASAFDTMLSSMVQVPMVSGTAGAVTTGASGYVIAEGNIKPVSRVSLSASQLNPLKALALAVITQELARSTQGAATQLIVSALRQACALATDAQFLSVLTSGVSVATSTGATAEAVRADIANLEQAMPTGSTSKLFIITTPLIAKSWSMLTDQKGVSWAPSLTYQGGLVNGVTVLVSDAVTAGQVIMVDAAAIVAASGEAELEENRDGSLVFDTNPDSPPSASTNVVSLWQMNEIAIRVERWFFAARPRSDSVAICSNAASYTSGNSPI